jgi:nonribosomal peptide synthetase DhbF
LFGLVVNVIPFDYDLRFAGYPSTTEILAGGPVDDLTLAVYDRGDAGGLRIDFDANPALYRAEELLGHQQRFLRLLEAIVAAPERPLGHLELLGPAERRQLLVDWNSTERPLPEATLPGLFEAQVARNPQAPALAAGEQTLSYAELNGRANRLAHYLIDQGVGPETLVAVGLPRSAQMVEAVLAVLKAGAAYLPLDPDYPRERLAYMLQDARPACVLSSAQVAERLPEGCTPLLLPLDHPDTQRWLEQHPETNPTDAERTRALRPQHPAYVIYTSGSTGTPKGVVIPQQAVVRLLINVEYVALGPKQSVLH